MSGIEPNLARATFATRARTVDHLGREQIADCPTAVSELWKNAWDAYARNVHLHLFAGDEPVAALTDDGHGMRYADLTDRWLIIGTESKLSDDLPVAPEARNGLPVRPRQGQKGIGRLSSAKLGSILLLVSKHRDDDFVAALLDWRMFENPYINLADVPVSTGTFRTLDGIFDALPSLVDALAHGIVEGDSDWRSDRIEVKEAWRRHDEPWIAPDNPRRGLPPSQRLLQGLKRLPFKPEHLADWAGSGTAMLIYELDDTLKFLPNTGDTNEVHEDNRKRFVRTLSSFVDPYSVRKIEPQFSYRADIRTSANPDRRTVLVGAQKSIDRTQVQQMEHQIEGEVGEDGVFRGRIRAFGEAVDDKVEFPLPKGVVMPDRTQTRVGAFELYIASMEFERINSTHSRPEHDRYIELASEYAGLLIYRDGLRVLPYGREDNDFFSIESKRSRNAGRYFWNHRQMFGRIALSRHRNPNLKDKAGREGFIDNTAAKTFRMIVGNILDQSARLYFGSASDIRKPRIEAISKANKAGRAEEEAKKLRARERKRFETDLKVAEATLPELLSQVEQGIEKLSINRDADIAVAASRISDWRGELAEASVQ